VTINGQAPGNEQLYRFEKSLQDRTSIKDVKMTSTRDTRSSTSNTRGRGLNFTITFHYRNFTK
jgi:hypothetical protein